MEKVNISINFNFEDFVGHCSVVETQEGCFIGMVGYYEEGDAVLSFYDILVYPDEEMLDGSFEQPVKDIISIRKAFPLERSIYFRLWGEYKHLSAHRPVQDWKFSASEVEPYLRKLVVIDFYDAENIEEHYIGKLCSYDEDLGLFKFSDVYSVDRNQLFRSLDILDASFIRFPNILEKSMYDKIMKGICWVS